MQKFLKILIATAFIFCNSFYAHSENTITSDTFVINSTPNGLGNKMFFLASQYAYAQKFNKDFCLKEPFPEGFNIPFRICTEEEIKKSLTKACFFPRFSPIFYKVEDCLTMTHRYLYGYLQDERFFAEEKDKIKEIFEFTEPLSDKLKSLSDKIQNNNSVSVHIRRGDYLKNPKIFPTMPLSYYEDGADYIQSKTKEPIHLFVFSDDTEWVTKNFKSKHSFTIVPQNSTIEDLHLMSLCQHNIIANSTYSWWAAYLNKNPNKIVIAPDYWSDKLKKWGKDIVLKDWIILHVKKDEK